MKHLPLPRTVDSIIKGATTGPVSPGWAMGAFYDPQSPFHTKDFELKLWGEFDPAQPRSAQAGSTNPDWFAHDHGGPEFLLILEGEVEIDFGRLEGDTIAVASTQTLRANETIVLPEGVYRRFRAKHVRALTVRRAHTK